MINKTISFLTLVIWLTLAAANPTFSNKGVANYVETIIGYEYGGVTFEGANLWLTNFEGSMGKALNPNPRYYTFGLNCVA